MKAGNFLKYVILIVIAVNLAIVAVVFLGSGTPKPTPLPSPNGYDDFVAAGQALNGNAQTNAGMSRNDLVALIAKNADALKILHTGLSRESRVPDNYSGDYAANYLDVLASFKRSVFFICAEGRLAELDSRTNDAANLYLDAVRYGHACSRGGVIISRLVGIACEAIALKPLGALNQSLDARQSAAVAQALEDIDAKEEPIEETLKHEKNWVRQTAGLRGQIIQLVMYKTVAANRKSLFAKNQKIELNRRQAMLDFAERAFELDHGQRPGGPTDLVPAYLKAIPKDPATGKDLALIP